MDIFASIKERHTVRTYAGKAIVGETLTSLQALIDEANTEGKLHIQLVNGKEDAFEDYAIEYGKWVHVTNYLALIGPATDDLDEKLGYYGEKIVLWAQQAGLRTGWVATQCTTVPAEVSVGPNERFVMCIAIGTSDQNGTDHKVKSIADLSEVTGTAPEWFAKGMEYAQLAPTAGNQQLFTIHWDGKLSITTRPGHLEKVDVGIAKYHFELGAGISHDTWTK